LLADARVDAICWNGTSASWLGLEQDRRLCRDIEAATGTPATSSVLAMVECLRRDGLSRVGLVSPYAPDVQQRIVATLASEGFATVAERHLGLTENFAFGAVEAERIERMIRATAEASPQAILVMCTNLAAAPLVHRLEAEIGIPILDSVATAIWGSLRVAGIVAPRLAGWGHLFRSQESRRGDLAPRS
jgi:maleate isomerase